MVCKVNSNTKNLLVSPTSIDLNVWAILIGCLLGDGYCENRSENTARIQIKQSNKNVEFLMWLHKKLANHYLCSPKKPRLLKTIGKKGKIYHYYRVSTYTQKELFCLYTAFYSTGVKKIPANIKDFLTPQLLAVLFMCDGAVQNSGAVICLDGFELEDLIVFQKALYIKWGFKTGIHKKGWKIASFAPAKSQSQNHCSTIAKPIGPKGNYVRYYRIYFPKAQMPLLSDLIKKYMMPFMYYKLNGY